MVDLLDWRSSIAMLDAATCWPFILMLVVVMCSVVEPQEPS